ncbi:MAG: ABC transporter ATP-binding protein [Phycisphaeraceae bacterium]|nr:ABC transporter ATP-binding protein [Phycisphaeraceae bacterium]
MTDAPANPNPNPTHRTGDWVVRCDNLGKRFKMYTNPWHRAVEWLTCNRSNLHRDFWAVRGVSFELKAGECLGVVGRNGSGKSTLLKMVTGVSVPTEGTAAIRGRVLSLIELGAGLNRELTGRQNVHNMARLLNFPADFARTKMEAIEDFADIGAFFDRPVRSYSSGMTVRLTFSIFSAFEPEVLIVDEALSVGDIFFVQKCTRRIHELLDRGTTMLLVSHDAGAITNLCDRAILLEQGKVAFEGEPVDAIARYHAALRQGGVKANKWQRDDVPKRKPANEAPDPQDAATRQSAQRILDADIIQHAANADRRHGAGGVRILACLISDRQEREASVFGIGHAMLVHVLVEAAEPVDSPRVGVRLIDRFGTQVFGQGTLQHGLELPALAPGDRLVVTFDIELQLRPGEYTLGVSTSEPDASGNPNGALFHDHINGLGPIRINHPPMEPLPFFGAARLPMSASCTLVPHVAHATTSTDQKAQASA